MKNKKISCPIELTDVSHAFGKTLVIQNLNITVEHGEFVVLVGPSGCGKTTLLSLLSGHTKPDSGRVVRNGVTRAVYQHDSLFPWLTVSQNISMGLNLAEATQKDKDLKDLIGLINLQGFENHYPHQLSGGMRQRVELARVVAGHSDILLMDEPFSALDYQTRLRMRRELIQILRARPRTVVFVTHDIEEAVQLADRVLVLSQRPTRVCRELLINSPHPRSLAHTEVLEAMTCVLDTLGLEPLNLPTTVCEQVA